METGLLTRGILTMEWVVFWIWIAPLSYVQRQLCFGRKSFSFIVVNHWSGLQCFFKFLVLVESLFLL